MDTIGAFEAKTHLSTLLDRVAKGEKITITRHGVPSAMLVPIAETETRLSHAEIVEGMRASIFSLKNEPEESVVGPLVLDSPFHE
jgi:prevent-host-death family protein